MSFRIAGLCALVLFTAGCSSLSGVSRLFGSGPEAASPVDAAAVASAPMPVTAPPPDDFCARVAANARDKAVANGFDTATQQRMLQQTFQQCAVMRQG